MNLCRGFLFIAHLLHSNVALLKVRTESHGLLPGQASSAELQQVKFIGANNTAELAQEDVALIAVQQRIAVHQRISQSSAAQLAGRRTLKYLFALKEWQRLNRTGVRCPHPAACECHCDCPNTGIGPPPPSPTACPVYPNIWPTTPAPTTAAPTTSGPLTTTPAPKEKPEKCPEGFVKMSDGTCLEITYKVVLRLEEMVEKQRRELMKKQLEMNMLNDVNCTSCPGAKKYFEQRPELLFKHQQYLATLKMFLGALKMYEDNLKKVKEKEKIAKDEGILEDLGPEFVPGEKKFRPHCEPWTSLNETLGKPTKVFCAVICRQQPSCVGFGWDPKSEWCLWYDDAKPQPKDVCTSQTKTEYLKKWQGPIDESLWVAIDKVHVFDGAIQKSLEVAKLRADVAAKFFEAWDEETHKEDEDVNATLAGIHKDDLSNATDYYGGNLFDTHMLRKQLQILRNTAYAMTLQEVHKRPVNFPDPPPSPKVEDIVEDIVIPEGLEEPLSDPPKILEWRDFPNSQDTKWSQQHPDCPMGTPCFCDCKCRGAPPQNFIEPPPPPYPPPPCPPPPLPPPAGMLSDIAVAQSVR